MNKQIYQGSGAIKAYLKPDAQNYSPLVELPSSLNPYLDTHNIHIYIKLLNTLPLSNVKSIPAFNMLDGLHGVGGKTVVESSSGNTVFSLGLLSHAFGIKKVKAIASRDVSKGKLDLLRIAGINVELIDGPICPSPNDPKSSITVARKQGKKEGWVNPGQYDNTSNPSAHSTYTGPQIYDQLDGDVSMFVAGLGTTGTLTGTAEFLRSKRSDIQIIGVVRAPNNNVPGIRTQNGLDEVAFNWSGMLTDGLAVVNEYDSYFYSLKLIRHGLLVGPSAGFAFAGVLRQLQKMEDKKELNTLRGKNIAFIAPDSMFPYVSDYFDVLGSDFFPSINNQLTGSSIQEASSEIIDVPELSVNDVLRNYQEIEGILTSQRYKLVDVRGTREYLDHHLPDSENVPYRQLESWLKTLETNKPVVFICGRGVTSTRATQQAQRVGVESFSMVGGTAKWSARGYPRITPTHC